MPRGRDRQTHTIRRVTRRAKATAIAAVLLGLAWGPQAALSPAVARQPPSSAIEVESDPPLRPAFDPALENYVVRCRSGEPTTVRVDAPAGTRVAIDGGPPRGGPVAKAIALAPGQRFPIEVHEPGRARTVHVRCLPRDFPAWRSERHARTEAEWFLVAPSIELNAGPGSKYVAIFDRGGVPVWWLAAGIQPADARLMADGQLAWARVIGLSYGVSDFGGYERRELDGSLDRVYATVGSPTDFHDTETTPAGGRLLLTYRQREGVDLRPWRGPKDATVVDSEIQELDAAGNLVWLWNSAGHVTIAEAQRWLPRIVAHPFQLANGQRLYDVSHINSVTDDGRGGLIVSMRHTDALYRIDRSTGAITWKLGGTPTPERLDMAGAGRAPTGFGGQHDARLLPDGSLTLLDNGTRLARPPRALRYRIDAGRRSATLLESLTEPAAGPSSPCCGNARRLPGGNWVVAWGGVPLVSESTADGKPTLRISFGGGIFTYRVFPIEPGRVRAAQLRAGMDAMHPR